MNMRNRKEMLNMDKLKYALNYGGKVSVLH